jgi:hypothetical protein
MARHQISATARIPAPAPALYAIIADYQQGHPQIIPRPPFVSLTVEQGGSGAGTAIRFEIRVMGQLQTIRSLVSEPEPGRVLVETNDNGSVTTFTVDPRGDGQAEVTIATEMGVRDGVAGAIERWMATRLLRPVYQRELAQLAEVATRR